MFVGCFWQSAECKFTTATRHPLNLYFVILPPSHSIPRSSRTIIITMDLQPLKLLGGYTAADLWDSTNVVLFTWILLIFFPKWQWTPSLTLITPVLHSLLYLMSMFSLILFPTDKDAAGMDFTSLEGVVTGFADPNVVFVGWVHYIAFDALVGRMILLDSLQHDASTKFHVFAVIPCLLFCCLLGPVGFFMYMVLRTVFLSNGQVDGTKLKIL